GGHVFCSATLIADDAALTAAHCVLPDAPDAVLVGPEPSSATRIAVRRTTAHPHFDPDTLADDIALVELEHSAGAAPGVPAHPAKASALALGVTVTVVGFGGTAPVDAVARRRRAGTSVIAGVGEASFTTDASPAAPCGGDSGGAALLDVGGEKILVGVIS